MAPGALKRASSDDRDLSPPPSKRKITTTTTNKAVANFFKPPSQKEPDDTIFQTLHDSLLVARYKNASTVTRPKPLKVAAFDFDDTLVTTKSGQKFARSEDDWKWCHPTVPARLTELDAEGYAIVVLSNQKAVCLRKDPKLPGGMKSLANFKGKISAVCRSLDLPLSVYAATESDIYRKPRTGMWDHLLKDYGLNDAEVDHDHSFFVGDAGGRAEDKSTGTKKDFACSDRDLASNVGVKYQSPEEFFLQQEPRPFTRPFDPTKYFESNLDSHTEVTPVLFGKKNKLDLVLFCGSPGVGKSTFYWNHMRSLGYARVNQDTLKTREKCMKVAQQLLEDSTSVVVDNTNADIEIRAAWIALARTMKVPVRLVHFTASPKLCEHNDTVRALNGTLMNPEKRTMLPKMAFTGFASRYREPKIEEGFEDISKVDFKFEGTEEQKLQWQKYWIS